MECAIYDQTWWRDAVSVSSKIGLKRDAGGFLSNQDFCDVIDLPAVRAWFHLCLTSFGYLVSLLPVSHVASPLLRQLTPLKVETDYLCQDKTSWLQTIFNSEETGAILNRWHRVSR
jgi:hypothetical protein